MTKSREASRITAQNLSTCDREPIHIPGCIQPHGMLVAIDPDTDGITHVSANLEELSGLTATDVLGRTLEQVFGAEASVAINRVLGSGTYAPSSVMRLSLPLRMDPVRTIVAHRHLGRKLVEIEGAGDWQGERNAVAQAYKLLTGLREARHIADLYEFAAREVRHLTGYDRVMIYRFSPEGHGSVIAEDKKAGLHPYLGLRYPATDIPLQARQLYVQQRVRSIPDIDYTPVPLLHSQSADAAPVDMSYCTLRAVSPIHLEYLRNMGVRATVAVSILSDGELWGMIVCHHGTALTPTADVRSLLDLVGQLLSLLIQKGCEAEALSERLRRNHDMSVLRVALQLHDNLAGTLSKHGEALLNLMGATGALVQFGSEVQLIGLTPELDAAVAIAGALRRARPDSITALADAGGEDNIAADDAATASGILLLPILNNPNDAIAWFRPEIVQTVRWGGEPTTMLKPVGAGERLSPRASFAEWTELLRGHAEPWSTVDLQTATDLRHAIADALLRRAEIELAQLSSYDPLTALPNRRTIESLIETCRTDAAQTRCALLFLDLDRFKTVNDTLGHAVGDHVLSQVAARLRPLTPSGGSAGRMGGDEFVVFLPGATRPEAEALAKRLLTVLSEPYVIDRRRHYTTVSIGVSCCQTQELDNLLREADEAMYTAKRSGGGRVVTFEPVLHDRNMTAFKIEQDLFQALENKELQVQYQPIVAAPARNLIGFEALLRWNHPTRGWISPAEFIPRAEESGLIVHIGAFVFETVLRQVAAWRMRFGAVQVSINLSARQLLDGSFSLYAERTLQALGVDATAICVEVTESALMEEAAVRELHRIRQLGIQVAVDDFGTGYSSLAYLQSLPVDYTKIDRSFISRLGSGSKADRFFANIVELSHTLGLRAVAEGCETEEQWQIIAAANCDAVQGWLISPALNAAAAEQFLAADRRDASKP